MTPVEVDSLCARLRDYSPENRNHVVHEAATALSSLQTRVKRQITGAERWKAGAKAWKARAKAYMLERNALRSENTRLRYVISYYTLDDASVGMTATQALTMDLTKPPTTTTGD